MLSATLPKSPCCHYFALSHTSARRRGSQWLGCGASLCIRAEPSPDACPPHAHDLPGLVHHAFGHVMHQWGALLGLTLDFLLRESCSPPDPCNGPSCWRRRR